MLLPNVASTVQEKQFDLSSVAPPTEKRSLRHDIHDLPAVLGSPGTLGNSRCVLTLVLDLLLDA